MLACERCPRENHRFLCCVRLAALCFNCLVRPLVSSAAAAAVDHLAIRSETDPPSYPSFQLRLPRLEQQGVVRQLRHRQGRVDGCRHPLRHAQVRKNMSSILRSVRRYSCSLSPSCYFLYA